MGYTKTYLNRGPNYGKIVSVDVCLLCRYNGNCDDTILNFCKENLKDDEYFVEN